ncbi:diguanylate cyclase [Ampullimonas aquatilis]|uniref:GGDEF domain-containing protein n=1 Tax=Ampullimonas aquatilis TaxID=1341549 RepID=UPI003C7936A0
MSSATTLTTPIEIAKETLKYLASKRIPPTPENYAVIYAQMAKVSIDEVDPAKKAIRSLTATLRETPRTQKDALQLSAALEEGDWNSVNQHLRRLCGAEPKNPEDQPVWSELVRELLRQWEKRHASYTPARKRESIEHVLNTFGRDSDKLYPRLKSLITSWSNDSMNSTGILEAGELPPEVPQSRALIGNKAAVDAVARAQPIMSEAELVPALQNLLAQTINFSVTERLGYTPELANEAEALAQLCQRAQNLSEVNYASNQLRQFWIKLELRGETLDTMVRGLLTLLQLLVHNMGELVPSDGWVKGQVDHVSHLLAEPLTPSLLLQAEQSFKEVIYRQGALKHSLEETQKAIRTMVAAFVDRLSSLTQSTGEYADKMGEYAHQIRHASDLKQLSSVLEHLLSDTENVQSNMLATRDELGSAKGRVEEYESRVRKLEEELETVSGQIREDPLTGALNRRGFSQQFEIEKSRCFRKSAPLCLVVIDIDHFKVLNDTYGHQTGDNALRHMSAVLKKAIRPTDHLIRYGGEEFVIMLPETDLEFAYRVMIRVQRELSQTPFAHQETTIRITFSAGIAKLDQDEGLEGIIERADRAMYQAKKAGRNRVELAK